MFEQDGSSFLDTRTLLTYCGKGEPGDFNQSLNIYFWVLSGSLMKQGSHLCKMVVGKISNSTQATKSPRLYYIGYLNISVCQYVTFCPSKVTTNTLEVVL